MSILNFKAAEAAERGHTVHLESPDGSGPLFLNGKPITITVLGQDSRQFRAAAADIAERMRGRKTSLAGEERNTAELLAAVTLGWDNIEREADGKAEPWKFSREAAIELYQNPDFRWIREQVDKVIVDRSAFLAKGRKP